MLHRMYQKLAVEGAPFSVCDLITEEMVVLVMFMIFPSLRGEHQHKRDIDTIIVVAPELLILSLWQSFVTTEKPWQDVSSRRICNSGDHLEPASTSTLHFNKIIRFSFNSDMLTDMGVAGVRNRNVSFAPL